MYDMLNVNRTKGRRRYPKIALSAVRKRIGSLFAAGSGRVIAVTVRRSFAFGVCVPLPVERLMVQSWFAE